MATYYVRPDGSNANTGLADTAAGAWQTVAYAVRNASNGVLAAGDTVHLVGDQGNYTENNLTPDRAITIRGLRGATRGKTVIDGTGGAAGSDVWTGLTSSCTFIDIIAQNAVDRGWQTSTNQPQLLRCEANTNGGSGAGWFHVQPNAYCTFRGNAGSGVINGGAGLTYYLSFCEAGDNGADGFNGTFVVLANCHAYDNAGDGIEVTNGQIGVYANCTAEGNGGAGMKLAATTNLSAGSAIKNCAFTNNGTYGIDSSAGAQTAEARCLFDYNNFYGNATAARRNVTAGANDTANDPGFVNAAGDDYTLDTGSAMIGAGYSPFKSPMLLNQGATIAEVAGASGGGPLVNGGLAR